jgi:hypothetical protein
MLTPDLVSQQKPSPDQITTQISNSDEAIVKWHKLPKSCCSFPSISATKSVGGYVGGCVGAYVGRSVGEYIGEVLRILGYETDSAR